jgi:NADH-quinone oxidoreductase subunit L
VILSLHEEHDIFRMGGLRRSLPVTFWTFLIGAASLAGFPLITAGFYSKDELLWHAWNAGGPIPWLWIGGVVGAFLTAVYSFRLVFRVFFGDLQTPVHRRAGWIMLGPLIVLAALSLVAGFIETPRTLGHLNFFSGLMETALPVAPADEPSLSTEWIHQIGIMAVSLLGIGLAYLLFVRRPDLMTSLSAAPAARAASNLWLAGWGFDRLYDVLVVQPFLTVAEAGRRDVVDRFYTGLAHLIETGHRLLRLTQTGHVRWYAAMIGTGVVLLVGVFMMAGQG